MIQLILQLWMRCRVSRGELSRHNCKINWIMGGTGHNGESSASKFR